MAEHDSERRRARPPVSSQGVVELLERWVSDLERGGPGEAPSAEVKPPRNRAAASRHEPDPFSTEPPPAPAPRRPRPEARPPAPAAETMPLDAFRAARAEIRLQGPVALLPPGDAQIVLGREGGGRVHRGTVGVRGPCAPTREELTGLGLTEAQAHALEFVLAWFGAPFDAVSTDAPSQEGPCWGAWPLSGPALAEALARWKRRDTAGFEARLGRLGLDATLAKEPGASTVTVQDLERGQPVTGREALALLEDDARLLAALAQAGRERGAQLAQLEYVTEQVLRPSLALAAQATEADEDAEAPFSAPRALALLLHAALRLGHRGTGRLLAHVRTEGNKPEAVERAGQHLAAELQGAGRGREAAEVRRILSSPELATVSA